MATNDLPTQNRTAPDRLGSYGVPRLGVDMRDRAHYLDAEHDRVLVARDGDVVRVQNLGGRPVVDWVAYVAEECGWRTQGSSQILDALAGLGDE